MPTVFPGWTEGVKARSAALAKQSTRPTGEKGVTLTPLNPVREGNRLQYKHVTLTLDPAHRLAQLELQAPTTPPPANGAALQALGADN